jgi:hypothetical protein
MNCEVIATNTPGMLWCPVCEQNAEVDLSRGAYRRRCKKGKPQQPGVMPIKPCGPGCQLRKLLKGMGFTEGDCDCAAMAAKMDQWGIEGSREHLAEIVEHLEREAAKAKQSVTREEIEILVLTAIGKAMENCQP